jgi:hypothetical protein
MYGRARVPPYQWCSTGPSDWRAAYAYWDAGRFDDAVALFLSALADRGRVLGPEHEDTRKARDLLTGLG